MTTNHSPATRPMVDPDVARNLGMDPRAGARRWAARVASLLVIVALAAGGWVAYRRATRPLPTLYQTAAATRGDVLAGVESTGTIEPLRQVSVGPDVSGRIVAVHVDYNDAVTEGQVLVEIDSLPFQARRAEARARVQAARAGLRQARATLADAERRAARLERLSGTGAIAEQDVDTARTAVLQAEASVSSARAQIALAQASLASTETELERTSVRSPVDGVVLVRAAEPGQAVAASFQPPILFIIAEDLTRMELRLAVDEADIGRIEPGQAATFTVDAYPERDFEATVRSVRNSPRTVQGVVTYEVVLSVDNGGGLLRPGMTASAHIAIERVEDALRVPNAALRFTPPEREAEGTGVWLLRDGEPTRVEVEPGLTDGSLTSIRGEIESRDEVIVDVVRSESE